MAVSKGVTVSFGTLAGRLRDVNRGGKEVETVDATHQQSADEVREYLAGLIEGGEVTLQIIMGSDSVLPADGHTNDLELVLPDGGTFAAPAIFTGANFSAALGELVVFDCGFKVSGADEFTPAP